MLNYQITKGRKLYDITTSCLNFSLNEVLNVFGKLYCTKLDEFDQNLPFMKTVFFYFEECQIPWTFFRINRLQIKVLDYKFYCSHGSLDT